MRIALNSAIGMPLQFIDIQIEEKKPVAQIIMGRFGGLEHWKFTGSYGLLDYIYFLGLPRLG
jgi:hypothetical protein